ncbi:MAG: hypothetical protein KJ047_03925 [Anaerolineae bacterium]|nr:hypothetical protein [Anaerolineae bacterium]
MIREDRSNPLPSQTVSSGFTTHTSPILHFRNDQRFLQLLFITLHFPLGLVLRVAPSLGAIQAGLIVLIGLRAVSRSSRSDITAISALGYLMGGEVLWRMLGLSPLPPYEGGKYAAIVIATVGIMRRYRHVREWPLIPFLYLLCLLPSMIMLLGEVDLAFARGAVVGNLTGPMVLGLCSLYLAGVELNSKEVEQLATWVLAPILSISALVLYGTYEAQQAGNLYFSTSSNMTTSAEFGPNQVSNTLALGALICWLWLVSFRTRIIEIIIILFILLGLTTQILLTFSRGGAYVLGLCIVGTVIVQALNVTGESPAYLGRWIRRLSIALPALIFVVWPWVDDFTEGALTKRYSEEDTVRTQIIATELDIWRDHPVFGVGPGRVQTFIRQYSSLGNQTHTEFTRLLAEHGMFGAFGISLLISGVIGRYRRNRNVHARTWIISCAAYTFLYMTQAATRTVAPAVMYALIWTQLFSDPE